MKKFAALTAAIAIALVVGGITAAAADGSGNSCDAGHGAFGAFSHHFAANGGVNWIAADAKEDGGLGHATGPTNSGFSDFCNG